jgi:hypothetical protein
VRRLLNSDARMELPRLEVRPYQPAPGLARALCGERVCAYQLAARSLWLEWQRCYRAAPAGAGAGACPVRGGRWGWH